MKVITAIATTAARSVTTKFGDRQVLDAIGTNGEKYTVWRPANDTAIRAINPNQQISLALDSKGKVSLLETEPENKAIAQSPKQETKTDYSLSKSDKKAIASYIEQQKDLLAFCWQQAATIPGHESEEITEKLAVTLYLSAQRKFNLA